MFKLFFSLHNLFPLVLFTCYMFVCFGSIIHVTDLNEVSPDALLTIHVLCGIWETLKAIGLLNLGFTVEIVIFRWEPPTVFSLDLVGVPEEE